MVLFAIVNGQQVGPFSPEELVGNYAVDAATMVWHEGLPQWVPASSVPEMMNAINARFAPQPVVAPEPQPVVVPPTEPQTVAVPQPVAAAPVYSQPTPVNEPAEPRADVAECGAPYNWMYLAIVGAVLGTFFYIIGAGAGVAALILSLNAQNKYKAGDVEGAFNLNKTAKILTFVGLGISAFVVLCMLIATIRFTDPVTMAFASSIYYW